MPELTCFRLLDAESPAGPLAEAVRQVNEGQGGAAVFALDPISFEQVPNAPFAYWVEENVRRIFKEFPPFEVNGWTARQGLATGDDFRFVRCWWEVPVQVPESQNRRWWPFAKGGEYSPYYSDIHLLVNYEKDGAEMLATDESRVQNIHYYFKPGLTYPRRLHKLSPSVMPAGTVISVRGSGIYMEGGDPLDLLSLCSAETFDYLLKLMLGRTEHPQFDNGVIMRVPVPALLKTGLQSVRKDLLDVVKAQRARLSLLETNIFFHHPSLSLIRDEYLENENLAVHNQAVKTSEQINKYEADLNHLVDYAYGIKTIKPGSSSGAIKGKRAAKEFPGIATITSAASRLASYLFGCAMGRYNIQLAEKRNEDLSSDDVFRASPVCCPATQDSSPRLFIIDDIFSQSFGFEIATLLPKLFPQSHMQMEVKLGGELSRKSIYDYYRESSGFFADHLHAFSMSQRSAPIYWPLSTRSGEFVIWVYYPKLDADSLPRLITEVLDPRLRILNAEISALAAEGQTAARRSKLEALRLELAEMRQDFQELITKGYKPNLNDGVMITACPLAKYFRHPGFRKELESCWKKLSNGDYDWAHLAMSMWPNRVLEVCKKDRSIAIAHGKEELCPAEPVKASRSRKKPN